MGELCNQRGQSLAFEAFFNKTLRKKIDFLIFYSNLDKILREYSMRHLTHNCSTFQYLFLFFLNKQNKILNINKGGK